MARLKTLEIYALHQTPPEVLRPKDFRAIKAAIQRDEGDLGELVQSVGATLLELYSELVKSPTLLRYQAAPALFTLLAPHVRSSRSEPIVKKKGLPPKNRSSAVVLVGAVLDATADDRRGPLIQGLVSQAAGTSDEIHLSAGLINLVALSTGTWRRTALSALKSEIAAVVTKIAGASADEILAGPDPAWLIAFANEWGSGRDRLPLETTIGSSQDLAVAVALVRPEALRRELVLRYLRRSGRPLLLHALEEARSAVGSGRSAQFILREALSILDDEAEALSEVAPESGR